MNGQEIAMEIIEILSVKMGVASGLLLDSEHY